MPTISVIICTRDRPSDLNELLVTVCNQDYPPFEVIIVDDSRKSFTENIVQHFYSKLQPLNCQLKYVHGSGDGLPAARNLGINLSTGDVVLFLDDDTLINTDVLRVVAVFFNENPNVLGVQPKVVRAVKKASNLSYVKFQNIMYKALMVTCQEENKFQVRRSGATISPNRLTKVVAIQRLNGCCFSFRRRVFDEFCFDVNLKRWGLLEDLDFSFRVYKKYPGSLFTLPLAVVIHKTSEEARLPNRTIVGMITVYWFYIFFKDVYEGSILNLIAFFWGLTGSFFVFLGKLFFKKNRKRELMAMFYLLRSYLIAIKNLGNILSRQMDFFNKEII